MEQLGQTKPLPQHNAPPQAELGKQIFQTGVPILAVISETRAARIAQRQSRQAVCAQVNNAGIPHKAVSIFLPLSRPPRNQTFVPVEAAREEAVPAIADTPKKLAVRNADADAPQINAGVITKINACRCRRFQKFRNPSNHQYRGSQSRPSRQYQRFPNLCLPRLQSRQL